MDREEDTRNYRVLVNEEEQYSLWLADLAIPNGWKDCGVLGPKADCLKYVGEVWTDMRPKSLREHMKKFEEEKAKREAAEQQPAQQQLA